MAQMEPTNSTAALHESSGSTSKVEPSARRLQLAVQRLNAVKALANPGAYSQRRTLHRDLTQALGHALAERLETRHGPHQKASSWYLAALARANGICSSVFGLDTIQKLLQNAALLTASLLRQSGTRGLLADVLADVSRTFGQARMVNRLLQLPLYVEEWIRSSKSTSAPALLARVMTLSMLIYYPAEQLYWLSTLRPRISIDGSKWSRISCQAWGVYLIADLLRELFLHLQPQATFPSGDVNRGTWKKLAELSVEVADLPLAAHWSLKAGLGMNDLHIAAIGLYSGLVELYVKSTAHQNDELCDDDAAANITQS